MVVPLVVLVVEVAVHVEQLLPGVLPPQAGRGLAPTHPVVARVLRRPVEEPAQCIANLVQVPSLSGVLREQHVVAHRRGLLCQYRREIDALQPEPARPRLGVGDTIDAGERTDGGRQVDVRGESVGGRAGPRLAWYAYV